MKLLHNQNKGTIMDPKTEPKIQIQKNRGGNTLIKNQTEGVAK